MPNDLLENKKVSFSNFNTLFRFNKNEPTIYMGKSANNTRIMNYIFYGFNLILLIGFILLFYFLDMMTC